MYITSAPIRNIFAESLCKGNHSGINMGATDRTTMDKKANMTKRLLPEFIQKTTYPLVLIHKTFSSSYRNGILIGFTFLQEEEKVL